MAQSLTPLRIWKEAHQCYHRGEGGEGGTKVLPVEGLEIDFRDMTTLDEILWQGSGRPNHCRLHD